MNGQINEKYLYVTLKIAMITQKNARPQKVIWALLKFCVCKVEMTKFIKNWIFSWDDRPIKLDVLSVSTPKSSKTSNN